VNFTDRLVKKGVSGGTRVELYREKDGFEFFVCVGKFERGVACFHASIAQCTVSAVIEVRAAIILRFEEVVGPAQNFFDGGDEVFFLSCKVSEGVRDVVNLWSWQCRGAKEVGCGLLG
jgi:hypothetical protein